MQLRIGQRRMLAGAAFNDTAHRNIARVLPRRCREDLVQKRRPTSRHLVASMRVHLVN